MCFLVNSYMSLLRSEIILKFPSYKHIAPPEQGSSHNDGDFLCKARHIGSNLDNQYI
jgi:hypothetical protein